MVGQGSVHCHGIPEHLHRGVVEIVVGRDATQRGGRDAVVVLQGAAQVLGVKAHVKSPTVKYMDSTHGNITFKHSVAKNGTLILPFVYRLTRQYMIYCHHKVINATFYY